MKYRPEIDGLRAVAVLPVILFHAGFPWLSGGFVGVDVFFVISGYLISSILMADLEANQFSFARFYERRARRILPALLFVLGCCVPLGWILMFPDELREFGQALFATIFFASNIKFLREANYFSPAAELNPLLHTWSLSVEEQFYIVFPLLLVILWKFARHSIFHIVLAGTILSLLLAELGWRTFPDANYYLLPTRAWELGSGVLCCLLPARYRMGSSSFLAAAGLLAIAIAVAMFDQATPFPSLYALLPVAGAALVILYAGKETVVARLLAQPVFVTVGVLSYSAYLWHQPVFAFARLYSLRTPSAVLMLALVVVVFLLAYCSWRWVERPWRSAHGDSVAKPAKTRLLTGCLGAAMASLAGVGLFLHIENGALWRLPPETAAVFQVDGNVPGFDHCSVTDVAEFARTVAGCTTHDAPIDVLMYGDSHVGALIKAVQVQAAQQEPRLNVATVYYPGCIPVRGLYRLDKGVNHACVAFNEAALAFARENGIRIIVIGGRWPLYASGLGFDNQEGGKEEDGFAPVDSVYRRIRHFPDGDEGARQQRVTSAINSHFARLEAEGINAVVIQGIPEAGWNVPQLLAKTMRRDGQPPEFLTTDQRVYQQRTGEIHDIISAALGGGGMLVDPAAILCDVQVPGRCLNSIGAKPLYKDDDHLSYEGAVRIAPAVIRSALLALGKGTSDPNAVGPDHQ